MSEILSAVMNINRLNEWSPPDNWAALDVVDAHAAGEPFRLVTNGLPPIPGDTVIERRRYAMENLDHLRRVLMWEPRGHSDMYGGWLSPAVREDSEVSILFLHNEGFSTMCGHGIIALTTILLETGAFPTPEPGARIGIDTPAGQIHSTATVSGNRVTGVTFRNVPSFVDSLDNVIDIPGMGAIEYDLAFGGAYYAYVDAEQANLAWPPTGSTELTAVGRRIKQAIMDHGQIEHPDEPELGFLYGVIFTGPPENPQNDFRNVCVFADGEIDRSPTGTGVSGRLAIEAARGRLSAGEALSIESIIGSVFTVKLAEMTTYGGVPAVIPEVTGTAHITGRSRFWVDPEDPLARGFLIK